MPSRRNGTTRNAERRNLYGRLPGVFWGLSEEAKRGEEMGATDVKYVILADAGIEHPVVFSSVLDYTDVVKAPADVVAAGLCLRHKDGRWTCWGRGASLRMSSRGKLDEEILSDFLSD